jgi:hypothetical protein
VADAGYLGSNWQEAVADFGLTLMTGAKKAMKKLMSRWQHSTVGGLPTDRERLLNTGDQPATVGLGTFFAHYIWCLLAYQLRRMEQLEQKAEQTLLTEGVA